MIWPLITLDFEASSLGSGSYPIKVGIAIWRSPVAPVEIWSALIGPTARWELRGDWSARAEAIHDISLSELLGLAALAPKDVMLRLNETIGTATAWCDGGDFDQHWLSELTRAAGVQATWSLGDPAKLLSAASKEVAGAYDAFLRSNAPVHRAAGDALRLLGALSAGLGFALESGPP